MNNTERILGKLVVSQLNNLPIQEETPELVDELLYISQINQINYLVLGKMLQWNISEEKKNMIRGRIKKTIVLALLQVTELSKIEQAFEQNQIKCQPMKGALLKFIYPKPEMREMSDIDILVDEKCFEKCNDILKGLGYFLYKDIDHHMIYTNGNGILLEIHRSLYDVKTDKNQYEYFKDLSKCHTREGYKYIYDFDLEDYYVFMVAHMARHFYKKGCGIRNLVDLYVFHQRYENDIDWNYVDSEMKKLGIYDFNIHMTKLSRIWLTEEEGSTLYDNLFTYMMNDGVYGKDENGFWNKCHIKADEDGKDIRKKLRRWYYFPTLDYMKEYYLFLNKFPFLLPIAWFIRGINGVFGIKGTGKERLNVIKHIDKNMVCEMSEIYQTMKLDFHKE